MDMLFESNLGYVECDVCGNGYNSVRVFYDNYAPKDTPFTFERRSNCYENLTLGGLSKDELLSQMEASKFLIATRYARRNWREFMGGLQRGKFDSGIAAPELIANMPTYSPPPVVGWEDELLTDGSGRCMDVCCNPNHAANLSRPTVATDFVTVNEFSAQDYVTAYEEGRPTYRDLRIVEDFPF